jgi:branched-chain amino acid transport system ATP-binding protein
MTVEENLIMGSLTHKARPKRRECLQRVYSFFPLLEQKRRQYARTLSGGEQQLCAVGRGLMSIPRLLMFDEPSLGLAPLLVQEIFHIVQRINQEGVTVLLVEQNVKQTLNICDHAYLLENGRIVLEGSGKELLNNDYVKQAYLGM